MLRHIEYACTCIFKVSSPRPWLRGLLGHIAALFLAPLLLLFSLVLSTAVHGFTAQSWAVQLLPFVMTWLGLTLVYWLVPSTVVKFWTALIGGLFAAMMWTIAKITYAYYTAHAFVLHDLYGSLSVIPLFFLWVYLSWLIFLFGAQLTSALRLFRPSRH